MNSQARLAIPFFTLVALGAAGVVHMTSLPAPGAVGLDAAKDPSFQQRRTAENLRDSVVFQCEDIGRRSARFSPQQAMFMDYLMDTLVANRFDAELFEYEVPEGWEQLPPTQFRIVNLRLGAEPPAEITLVMLMGDGGGVRANVDRWRRQVGLAPMSDEEFLALEDRTLFDNPAKYVELRGSYEGMDGTRIADAGLYGAIFARNQSALFVKTLLHGVI